MNNAKIEAVTSHTDEYIKGFFGKYRWLSNYLECDIEFEDAVYGSSEAAYQAAKSLDPEVRVRFRKVKPNESKQMGKTIDLRPDWEEVKDDVMYKILKFKFTFHPVWKAALLATGDKYLEETNYWGDTYWGVCDGKGRNQLGLTLMKIRKELQDENMV